MRRLSLFVLTAVAIALGAAAVGQGGKNPPAGAGLLPDMRTVVPAHLNLVNEHQQETLRFSNGVANTGPGPWALRPDPPISDAIDATTAVQEIRDSNTYYKCGEQPKQVTDCYKVVQEIRTGTFVYHPAHNHWHIGDVALFEVRKGSPTTGKIVGGNSIKTTFCLIDWYQLDGKSPNTTERAFFDCYSSYQGISTGWVDQYHQSTQGQQLDLTGVPNADDYYLVSTANYARRYVELDYTNNTAWVRFRLYTDSNGNRKIEVLGHSPCEPGTGLCGENTTNR
jgi:hypothetical protein